MTKRLNNFSLTPEWPAALPDHCQHCGNGYDIRSALEIGPGQFGRFLRRIAPWMTILMFAIMFATKLSFLSLGGNGGAMAFAVALILPSIVLWIIGGILPTKARVYCFKCDKSEFFPPPKFLDNRIPAASE